MRGKDVLEILDGRAAVERNQSRCVTRPQTWSAPGLLPAPFDPVPSLSPDHLPTRMGDWIADTSDRLQVPLEFIACPSIIAAGSVLGRRIALRPKANDDWAVPPNLWGALVGPAGSLKTPSIGEALQPVRDLESRAREEFAHQSAAVQASALSRKARIDSQKKKIESAVKGEPTADVSGLEAELAALIEDQGNGVTEKRFIVNDATVEKLGELLNSNPRGLLLFRDELTGWLSSFERAGRESDRAFFLEAWGGTGRFCVDRIGRGTLSVPSLTISIVGGIQPDRLKTFFSGAMNEGGDGDGLLQRFQLLVWPDQDTTWEYTDRSPNMNARRAAFRIFENLEALDPVKIGADPSAGIPFLRFAPDAQELFAAWLTDLMTRIREPEAAKAQGYSSHLVKYSSLFPKLALVFHLVEIVSGGAAGPVSLTSARLAAAWCEFLEGHARRVYAPELRGDRTAALALAEKIKGGDVPDGVSVRDVYRREWSGLRTAGEVYAALDVLGPIHWAKVEPETTAGRDREAIRVNPAFKEVK